MDPADAVRVWGKEFLPDIELIDRTIAQVDIDPASRILDVGTGWGVMAISLASHGFHVTTGNPEDNEIQRHGEDRAGHAGQESHRYGDWRRSAESLGVGDRIRYQPIDAEKLPFPSASFHGVFLYDTLQHIQNRQAALQECLRVTRAKGVVCVIETNDRGVGHCLASESFEIERLDPRDYLENANATVEVLQGRFSDAFLIRVGSTTNLD